MAEMDTLTKLLGGLVVGNGRRRINKQRGKTELMLKWMHFARL